MMKYTLKYAAILLAILVVFHVFKVVQQLSKYPSNGIGDLFYKVLLSFKWALPIYIVLAAAGGFIIGAVLKKREDRLGQR
ncbi:hypothetical protein [Ohtaekwangia sp.]|uniref:hypothetical protein n=1 Tax=Ohtaekwangia sp. TaxID=2066019 RepID=UPI002F9377A5